MSSKYQLTLPLKNQLASLRASAKLIQSYLLQEKVKFALEGSFQANPELTISVYYEGPAEMMADVERLLFTQTLKKQNLGPKFRKKRNDQQAAFDLEFCSIHPWGQLKPDAFPFKFWLEAKTKPLPIDKLRLSKDFRRSLQRIKGEDYKVHSSFKLDDWQWWLEEMVIPTARQRHRQQTSLPSSAEMKSLAREGELILVSRKEKPIAGTLIHQGRLNQTLFVWRVGMASEVLEDAKLYKSLNVYLDLLAYQKALDRKAAWFSLGPTLARYDQGLFRYKRAWGCGLYNDPYSPLFELRFGSEKKCEILRLMPIFGIHGQQTVLHLDASLASPREAASDIKQTGYDIPDLAGIWAHTAQGTEFIELHK